MTNKEKYYTFCDIEKTVPIFSQAWWLDAVCGDDWDVCLQAVHLVYCGGIGNPIGGHGSLAGKSYRYAAKQLTHRAFCT